MEVRIFIQQYGKPPAIRGKQTYTQEPAGRAGMLFRLWKYASCGDANGSNAGFESQFEIGAVVFATADAVKRLCSGQGMRRTSRAFCSR